MWGDWVGIGDLIFSSLVYFCKTAQNDFLNFLKWVSLVLLVLVCMNSSLVETAFAKDPNLERKNMKGEQEVKLLGFWVSTYSHRVKWALELKGIDYQYIEEDIANNRKSQLLLDSNPVHKKTPVLLHRGLPIAESTVILEYIEETWPETPLMPADPYQRAISRFWIKFLEDKLPIFGNHLTTTGEEQVKAAKEAREVLRVLEEQCLGNNKFFGGNAVGLVDLAFGWLSYCPEATDEALGGGDSMKLMDHDALPRISAWARAFKEIPVIKRNLPDHGKLVAHLARYTWKKSTPS